MFEVDMKKVLLEKDIEKAVWKYAEEKGLLQYKFSSPNKRSVPDRLFITTGGFTFYIEFKKPGGVCTALQESTIKRMRDVNCHVFVVDDIQEGKNIIDWYAGGPA